MALGQGVGLDTRSDRGYTLSMKTAISIPDDLFQVAERTARRLGLSRSQFYQRAVAHFLEQQTDTHVTEALDEVYGSDRPASLDPLLDRMQRASLPREEW